MAELTRASDPFRFYTRLHLTELTGLKASSLEGLAALIKEVPGSCIYHHTHRFFQELQYLGPELSNDFAHWVTMTLGEVRLGEELASIDIVQFPTIDSLRERIASIIDAYMKSSDPARPRFAEPGSEFHFSKTVSFVIPTNYEAHDLAEFSDMVGKVAVDSIYFHIFEARLRLGKKTNDFSNWISTSLQEPELANKIARLDPYSYTLEDLRGAISAIIQKRIAS
jgi:hypothetical protein